MKIISVWSCFLLAFLFVFSGCKKEEIIVTGNQAPEDPTISNLLKENFIQKIYLQFYGRQPSDSEMVYSFAILNKNNCSVKNRKELFEKMVASDEYRSQLYNIENTDMLNGLTDNEIDQCIIYFQQQLNNPANAGDYNIILAELQKTQLLRTVKAGLLNGTMSLVNAHRIIADSPSYENITGSGSEWIKAIFLRFLFREPTETEMENCTEMLGFRSETLFLQEGSSKDDLVNIFFSSQEYFEGQVRTLFQRYLFREPNADESVSLTHAYMQSNDYKSLQMKIVLGDEFLGVK